MVSYFITVIMLECRLWFCWFWIAIVVLKHIRGLLILHRLYSMVMYLPNHGYLLCGSYLEFWMYFSTIFYNFSWYKLFLCDDCIYILLYSVVKIFFIEPRIVWSRPIKNMRIVLNCLIHHQILADDPFVVVIIDVHHSTNLFITRFLAVYHWADTI